MQCCTERRLHAWRCAPLFLPHQSVTWSRSTSLTLRFFFFFKKPKNRVVLKKIEGAAPVEEQHFRYCFKADPKLWQLHLLEVKTASDERLLHVPGCHQRCGICFDHWNLDVEEKVMSHCKAVGGRILLINLWVWRFITVSQQRTFFLKWAVEMFHSHMKSPLACCSNS